MIGAIIGDIVGSRFEFNNHRSKEFELFASECSYTDDTICTIAVADALLSDTDYASSLSTWCQKYPNPTGSYGANFASWLRSKDKKPYYSFGNGSAMRVSPCAFILRKQPVIKAVSEAIRSAECTHNHPEGVWGAHVVAMLIWMALQGKSLLEIERIAERSYPEIETLKLESLRANNTFNESCQVTVPQAIFCTLKSSSFEEAIRNAISIGGDSDTIACIAGGLAEAIWGIPQWMKDKALGYLPTEMINVIKAEYE